MAKRRSGRPPNGGRILRITLTEKIYWYVHEMAKKGMFAATDGAIGTYCINRMVEEWLRDGVIQPRPEEKPAAAANATVNQTLTIETPQDEDDTGKDC